MRGGCSTRGLSAVFVQFGERAGCVWREDAAVEPLACFRLFELGELDDGEATSGAGEGGVKAVDLFVGGEQDQGAVALAEDAIGEVEEASEGGAGVTSGGGAEVFVAVLGDDELPPVARRIVIAR